ncbi:MAG: DUF3341 domain-containing protein [Acidobacteria bacterium]|nr:MAG: DUF3341 domain-containing protein [Acidobacteriota bacterium]
MNRDETTPSSAPPNARPAPPEAGGKLFGLLAELADPESLMRACARVRDAGYTAWDAHTPFPIHGLDRAMGLGKSWVSAFVLVLGLSGAAFGMLMQWWISTRAYPLVISGKPLFSWPAFVPVMFECGVLGGALGALGGFLYKSRLPRHHHGLFASERFERVTDDAFFISIEASDPRFDAEETARLLREAGAHHVELVHA